MFRRADTIGNRVAEMLRDPRGWERNEVGQYRHPDCPFMVQRQCYLDCTTSLWDGTERVPLTGGEARRIARGLYGVDDYIRSNKRAAALHKFVEECGA